MHLGFSIQLTKIAWATAAQFLFRKGSSSPACPGSELRKSRLSRMVLGSGTKDKDMGTLCLLWPSQSPSLLKARLPEAQGGAGSSLPILVSHQAGPIMVPCIAAQRLGCPAPFLTASISPSGRESPLPCPVVHRAGSMPAGTSGGGGGQTVNYVKGSICGSYWCCWSDSPGIKT